MPSPFAPDSSFHVQWDITKSYIPQKEIDKQLFELGEVKVTARKKIRLKSGVLIVKDS